jgi:hypothetical protein
MTKKREADAHEAARHRLRIAYGDVRTRWPQVRRLNLELHFLDDNHREFAAETLTRGREDSAFLEIVCRESECVDGGFDLNSLAAELIRDLKTEVTGELACMGWQDQERIGKHHCLYQLRYTLRCEYEEVDEGEGR